MVMIIVKSITLLNTTLEAGYELKRVVIIRKVDFANDLVINIRIGDVSRAIVVWTYGRGICC